MLKHKKRVSRIHKSKKNFTLRQAGKLTEIRVKDRTVGIIFTKFSGIFFKAEGKETV